MNRGEPTSPEPTPGPAAHPDRPLDPDACRRRLQQLRRALPTPDDGRRIELYSRSARRRRVRIDGADRRVDLGVDEGLALRLGDRQGRELGFAAASGIDVTTVQALRAEAGRSAHRPLAEAPLADAQVPDDPADLDRSLPTVERLSEVLAYLSRGHEPAWIEAAETVEAIRTDDGPDAVRVRLRCWAMVRIAGIPHLRAARRLAALAAPAETTPMDGDSGFWVLAPEAAASLTRALAAVGAVGQQLCWRIRDEPAHPAAVSGGTFDDAGRPTRPGSSGARWLQRPSFLDPPRLAWQVPVVEATPIEAPGSAPVIGVLRIHPLAGEKKSWMLELPEQGRVGPACSPAKLARAVMGGFGDPRVTPDGTIAPSLVLDMRQAKA